jgi:hypothetical protein
MSVNLHIVGMRPSQELSHHSLNGIETFEMVNETSRMAARVGRLEDGREKIEGIEGRDCHARTRQKMGVRGKSWWLSRLMCSVTLRNSGFELFVVEGMAFSIVAESPKE